MKTNKLTPEQQQFIINNRLKMSINDMVAELKVSYYMINSFMEANNLKLDKKTVNSIKFKNKMLGKEAEIYNRKKDWVFDFWNSKINPITMFRT